MQELFETVMLLLIAGGICVGGFVLRVMFDDKREHSFTLKGFIKWLRKAGTDYKAEN